jgi:subtilisin family serine protease
MHGVAYNSKIIAIKVLDSSGNGTYQDVSDGISAAASAGAKVINLSLGGSFPNSTLRDSLLTAKAADVLTIAATGNDGTTQPDYPAYYASDSSLAGYVLAVGSVNSSSVISSFSQQCGDTMNYCLVAPGENIYAAYPTDTYATSSGTSEATPHVSGAAAVIRAAWTFLTAAQTAQILLQTATDLGAAGVDVIYGYGLLRRCRKSSFSKKFL